jgi:excisionase family DNA binding protein
MSLRKQLEMMVNGMPPGSSVSLSVDWLREELAAEDRAGDAPPELLTLDDVAERVGRAVSTVRSWCNSGQLEGAFRLNGRDWRVPASALQKYLEAQAKQEPSEMGNRGEVDLASWRRLRQKGKAA